MQKNRGKRIIISVTVVAALAATIILLACGGSDAGVKVPGNKRTAEQKQTTLGTKKESVERDDSAEIPETEGTVMPQKEIRQDPLVIDAGKSGSGSTWSAQQPQVSTGNQIYRQEPQTEATQPSEHVHAYVVTGTRKVEHPAVTEQVWVEDSAAWDEIMRAGYHVSVVTCHECGAQFSDPHQANALEAWGNHIDVAHDGDGGYDMAASYDVPAEILHHDASGHYETRVVTAAWTELIDTYACPCGDTYTNSR